MIYNLEQSYNGTGRKRKLEAVPDDERRRRERSTDEMERIMQGRELKEGKIFHLMTGGNVDYLSNILWLIRRYGHLNRVFVTSWALAGADILLLREQIEAGNIGQFDVMHDNDYSVQRHMDYQLLLEMHKDGLLRNLTRSTMHCKAILINANGEDKFVIITSANCTFNPRVEIQTMSINSNLYEQYDRFISDVQDKECVMRTLRRYPKLNRYVRYTDVTL